MAELGTIFIQSYNRLEILATYRLGLITIIILLIAVLLLHIYKPKFTVWLFTPLGSNKAPDRKAGVIFLAFSMFAACCMLFPINSYKSKILDAYENKVVREVTGFVSKISMSEGKGTFYLGETKLTYYKRASSGIHGFRDRCSPVCALQEGKRIRVEHVDGDIITLEIIIEKENLSHTTNSQSAGFHCVLSGLRPLNFRPDRVKRNRAWQLAIQNAPYHRI